VAASLTAGLAAASPAVAATATATYSTAGETPFIVPAGVTSVTAALTGAGGGAGRDPAFTFDDAPGGAGGTARATVAVAPGEVLFVEVGGSGGPGTGLGAGARSGLTAASGATAGAGGTGGSEDGLDFGGGGGGGGGLFGGGGGGGGDCLPMDPNVCGGGGGGGGGASGAPASATGVSGVQTGVAGNGVAAQATVTWMVPPPTVITGPVSALQPSTATLNGTVDPNGSHVTGCHFTVSPAPPAGANAACSPAPGTGNSPVAVSANLTKLTAGTAYTVTLSATTAQGTTTGQPVAFTAPAAATNTTVTTTRTITVTATPTTTSNATTTTTTSTGTTTTTHAGPPPKTATLQISAVTQTARVWRRGSHQATITASRRGHKRRPPVGTTFGFTLRRAASVRLAFARRARGIRSGKRCVPLTKVRKPSTPSTSRHARAKPPTSPICIRWPAAGTVTLTGHSGADKVRFQGRLAKRRLAPGTYRVTVSASAAGRRVSARPLSFRIVAG
jgi:hypothetical protein